MYIERSISIRNRVTRKKHIIAQSLEVKLPTWRAHEKQKVGGVREEKRRRKKIREEKVRRKKMQGRERGRTIANHCVCFPMLCGPGGVESRLAKAAAAEPFGAKHIAKSNYTRHTMLEHLGS